MDFKKEPSPSFPAYSGSPSPPPEYEMASSGYAGHSGQILLPSTGQTSRPLAPTSALQEIRMKTAPRTPSQLQNPFLNTSASTLVEIPKNGLSKQCKENLCTIGSVILFFGIVGGVTALVILYIRSSEVQNRPKFYEEKNYKGAFYVPHLNWERNGCVNLPGWINDKTLSIQVGPHCLEIYENDDCASGGQRKSFEKIFDGTFSHDDLEKIQMGKKISSFKRCP